MKIIKKRKEIIPLPIHPALPMIPPEYKPYEENKQTHEPQTEIKSPCYPEIDVIPEEEETTTENEPVAE
jgi:hypothetical protein